jgi:uncharacterized protein YndB with AHSA1/START domain
MTDVGELQNKLESYWEQHLQRLTKRAEEAVVNSTFKNKIGKWVLQMNLQVDTQEISTLTFTDDRLIEAPAADVFEAVLRELGPGFLGADQKPLGLTLKPHPGGHWLRELETGAGHWWGTVQAIKAPQLLEIHGPLFMSYPAISNLQFRLAEEDRRTRLIFTHRAMAYTSFDPQIAKGFEQLGAGWSNLLDRIRVATTR